MFVAVCVGCCVALSVTFPFECTTWPIPTNHVDELVLAALCQHGIAPAQPCADAVFIRRVYLDLIGSIPPPDAVRRFLQEQQPDKRAALINALLTRAEFADYWAMKWCDLLRVKSEFPINLWPNAVQAYHRWIRDAVRENKPYDQFARALLTASGSNFRAPPANFYRALQGRDPAAIADAVALTFMGARSSQWPADRRAGLAAFFSHVSYKTTAEWKEEIVYVTPAPSNWPVALFPDDMPTNLTCVADPRAVFADWLMRPDNPWFARAIVNRIWAWLCGRGLVHEADDIRPDNPPSNPALLAYLEQELVQARYDLRHVYRLILNSRTYQQSSIPRSTNQLAEVLCAYYPVRRLDAEVLADALRLLGGVHERYSSAIPEPFTFVPQDQRTIALADGSITSPFLELFGRPARDTGLESERNNQPTAAQRMYLLNSSDIQRRIERGEALRHAGAPALRNRRAALDTLYLTLLSRYPTQAEVTAVEQYANTRGIARQQVAADLAWALINSKEFLYRH